MDLLPLSPENAKEHLHRKERVHNFMISRGIKDDAERFILLKFYASSIQSNPRHFKIIKTICASSVTFKIFKKWIDKKLNNVKTKK